VVGETMTSGELTEWAAFEQVYGPILVHERIDVGLAQLGWIMARLWAKPRHELKLRDFMPGWYQNLTQGDAVLQGYEALMKMAEAK